MSLRGLTLLVLLSLSFQISLGEKDSENDLLLKWQAPYEFQRGFPYYNCGVDKEGRPIWVTEFGKYDLRKFVEKGPDSLATLDKYQDQNLLRMNVSHIEAKQGIILLCDMDGYSLSQLTSVPTIQRLVQMTRKFQVHARSVIHSIIVINTNALFETLYSFTKPALGELMDKVEVYGSNSARWKPVLIKRINKNQLPTWYGGSLTEKDIKKVYG